MNWPFRPIPLDSQTVLQPDKTADLPEVKEPEKDALE
jgi:hypothetical protein